MKYIIKREKEKQFAIDYLTINFKPKYASIIGSLLDDFIITYNKDKHGDSIRTFLIKKADEEYNKIIKKEQNLLVNYKKDILNAIKNNCSLYIEKENITKLSDYIIEEIYESYKNDYDTKPLHIYYYEKKRKYISENKGKLLVFYLNKFSINNNIIKYFYDEYYYIKDQIGIEDEAYKTILISMLLETKEYDPNLNRILQKRIDDYVLGKNRKKEESIDKDLLYLQEIEKLESGLDADIDYIYDYNCWMIDKLKEEYRKNSYKSKNFFSRIKAIYDRSFYEYIDNAQKNGKKINLTFKLRNDLETFVSDSFPEVGDICNVLHRK